MGKTVEEIFRELHLELEEAFSRADKKLLVQNYQIIPSVVVDVVWDDIRNEKTYRQMCVQGIRLNIANTAETLMAFAMSETVNKSPYGFESDYLSPTSMPINPEKKFGNYSAN